MSPFNVSIQTLSRIQPRWIISTVSLGDYVFTWARMQAEGFYLYSTWSQLCMLSAFNRATSDWSKGILEKVFILIQHLKSHHSRILSVDFIAFHLINKNSILPLNWFCEIALFEVWFGLDKSSHDRPSFACWDIWVSCSVQVVHPLSTHCRGLRLLALSSSECFDMICFVAQGKSISEAAPIYEQLLATFPTAVLSSSMQLIIAAEHLHLMFG